MGEKSNDFGLSRIGQMAVNAHDVERATAFYRDVLGMTHLFAVPGMSFFDCGGIRLMLGEATKEEFDHPASIIYYTVEDIAAAHETLVERGASFDSAPFMVHKTEEAELWMAFLRDTEDNLLAMMSEKPIQ